MVAWLGFAAACGGRAAPAASPRPATPPSETPAGAPPLATMDGRANLVCDTENREAMEHYNRGVRLHDAGDAPAAAQAYMQAIDLDGEFCDAMDNLAVILRRNDMVAEAIILYERSLAIAPTNQFALQNVGVAYRLSGRGEDALRSYRRLSELSPANPEGWFGIAQVSLHLDRPEDALVAARRAEALYVASGSELVGDARLLLGVAAARLRDWPTVRTALGAVHAKHPDDVEINLALAEAYLQDDGALDRPRARAFLDRARAAGASIPPELARRAQ